MNYPKSNVLRMLEGDRGHRTHDVKRKRTFIPPLNSPKSPEHLDETSKNYWNRYTKQYCITEADVPAFTYLCELVSEIEDVKKALKEKGRFFLKVTVDGAGVEHQEEKSHPAFKQLMELRKERRMLERDFSARYAGVLRSEHPIDKIIKR